ncbi:hypothetical protein [Pseudomonas citronellolis]|uniref:hypothetical protein n=1 Tax=Pseudomonas citronellolis TaxID=53408 RepID=UPI0023E3F7BF|nr:hypothetical protein [Pseudomonas citronellolis]MDF3934064.1 hypothetical protein [Pseudomonas citronellolis]
MGYLARTLVVVALSLALGLAAQDWTLFVQALPMGGGLQAMLAVLPLLAVGSGSVACLAAHPELG